jgi:hypothetical protein
LSVVSDVFSFADVPAVCCVGATVTVLTVPPAVTVCTMDDGSSVTLAEVASSSSVEVALVSEASVEDSSCPVVELSGVVEVVDVDVDLVDGFTVTVFCTVSVTLDTAMVVDIAWVLPVKPWNLTKLKEIRWIKIIQVDSWWADTRPITTCKAITAQSIIISQECTYFGRWGRRSSRSRWLYVAKVDISIYTRTATDLFGPCGTGSIAFRITLLYRLDRGVVWTPAQLVLSDGISIVVETVIMAQAVGLIYAVVAGSLASVEASTVFDI